MFNSAGVKICGEKQTNSSWRDDDDIHIRKGKVKHVVTEKKEQLLYCRCVNVPVEVDQKLKDKKQYSLVIKEKINSFIKHCPYLGGKVHSALEFMSLS